MRVLVTAANGDVGDAIGRIIRQCWPAWQVHGADMAGAWPGCQTFSQMHALPPATDPAYPEALADLADAVSADFVIPVSEPELIRLSTDGCRIAGERLVMNPPHLIRCFLDKQRTSDWMLANGLPAPRTVPLSAATEEHLPVIAKARFGHGNSGYQIVRTDRHLAVIQAESPDGWIAQELMEPAEQEYTCASIRLSGGARHLAMRRRLDGGTTVWVQACDRPEIGRLLDLIAEKAELDGVINVQLRLTDAGPRVFEINPRFSGTVMMRHVLGFQDLKWLLSVRCGDATGLPDFAVADGACVYRMAREVVAPPNVG